MLLAFGILCSLVQCGIELALEWAARTDCSVHTLLAEFTCLGLFAVTFYRFHRGDLTYLTWIYRIFRAPPLPESLDEEDASKLKWDLLALILRALAFVALAQSILNPKFFYISYAVLLGVDIPWLVSRYRQSKAWHFRCAETLQQWLTNNALTLVAMATLLLCFGLGWIDAKELLWLNALACFTNSVVDLVTTLWVYRPVRWYKEDEHRD